MDAAANHLDACQETRFLYPIPERPLSREVVDLQAAHLAVVDVCGKLVMAGPIVEQAGGLIVLRTDSAAEAMAIAEEDPLVRGAYQAYALAAWLASNRQNEYRS
jgi:uncharacterized protein YciI